METDKEMLQRLKEHLKEEAEAKKRSDEIAKRSFEKWSSDNLSMIARAHGYLIVIPKRKFGKIWEWLWK